MESAKLKIEKKEKLMFKKALFFVSVCLAGTVVFALAQDTAAVQGNSSDHPRIFELRDRIRGQREQITQALKDDTISVNQARDCRHVLDGVESDIKAESAANGPRLFMRREAYEAYNTRLDVNSAFIREKKQAYYYYGQTYDQHGYGN
jgi:hypothetical protein